ncbi:MAG TPA: cytochrome c biogenesis protein CcsA [Tepidisphaeraceae bacterium]|jgi:cytochrome c-type biogenesis protein CcsB
MAILFFVICCLCTSASALDVAPLRDLPVLDNGRVKPLDTLARGAVRFVTGREKFDNLDPLELLLRWQASPDVWEKRAILHVPNLALRKQIALGDAQHVSPAALRANDDFGKWVIGLKSKQQQAEKLGEEPQFDKLEQAALDLDHRLTAYGAARDGRVPAMVPLSEDDWLRADELDHIDPKLPDTSAVKAAWAGVISATANGNDALFADAAGRLKNAITAIKPDYADRAKIGREVAYNRVHPFRWTWVAYAVSLIALVAAGMIRRRAATVAAAGIFLAAMLVHCGAFAWRCSITGWAPVTNMYETVTWVSLMAAVFAGGIALYYRNLSVAVAGAAAAVIGGVVADVMPPALGHEIGNLTPVLRSNYWLTIHVLTIVSSYAAFVLAAVLGNVALAQFVRERRISRGVGVSPTSSVETVPVGETTTPRFSHGSSLHTTLTFTYRSIQIGVLLLAAGTILGGLWADQSWGRFWGWDPKEVWALIALLTYLALLHGRFAGWIGQFGLAAGAALCFSTVLMSWYGVNFVLGAGLHSYGFGTGGQGYVASFVGLQVLYVVVARLLVGDRAPASEETVKPEIPPMPQLNP